MYGQDYYPEGHQGGLSIIMHDERIASNGDVRLEPSPGQWSPIPKPGKREANAATQEIRVALSFPDAERDRKGFNPIIYPDLKLNYTVRARPEGESIRVSVDFDAPIPKEWVGKVGFNLELFPGLMFGKSYQLGETSAVFQRQPSGPGEIPSLARGKRLEVAPETGLYHLTIEAVRGGELELLDGRGNHNNGWFVVRALAPAGAAANAIEWLVTPHAKAGWIRTPVIQVSQVGYHPAQPKQAILEFDVRDSTRRNVILQRIGQAGQVKTIIDRKPAEWGKFLRYQYATLDFSDVKEPGSLRGSLRRPGQQSIPHQHRRFHARGLAADARIFPAGADVPHEGAGEIPAVARRLPPRRCAHGAGEPQPLRRLSAGVLDAHQLPAGRAGAESEPRRLARRRRLGHARGIAVRHHLRPRARVGVVSRRLRQHLDRPEDAGDGNPFTRRQTRRAAAARTRRVVGGRRL
jgi:hypothetical protein